MDTKFISAEGYKKISGLKGTTKKKLNTAQKLLRFIKRVPKEIYRDMKAIKVKFSRITWSTLTLRKFVNGVRKFHLSSSYFEFMRTPKGIATMLAPVCAAVVLILTVCFWTCGEKSLNVYVDGKHIATIQDESVLNQASANLYSALSTTSSEADTVPVMQISLPSFGNQKTDSATVVYEKLVDTTDAVTNNAGGLYIDGVFYGATENADDLQDALITVLSDAKARYDETTTTTFENNVEVVRGVYPQEDMKTAEEIITVARSNMSVRLETDLSVEYELAYSTEYEYDHAQPDTYSHVRVEGENGLQKVNYRLVYIDGVQTDAIPQNTTVIKEPTTQVLVLGTQQSYTGDGTFTWPVPYTHNVTSPFEYRWGTFHYGIDISWNGCHGQDIVASQSGVVTWAGWDTSGYGNYVIIDHQNGFTTMYAHCDEVFVSIGDKVLEGDTIATVGNTGYSTGSHLHYEIWDGTTKVDPLIYVS